MTNDNEHQHKNKPIDDEYQYPEEEYVTETTPTDEERKPQNKNPIHFIVGLIERNKRVAIVIAIIIIALIVFKLMATHDKPRVITESKPKSVAATPQQPVQQTLAQLQPNSEVTDQLSTLKQNQQANQTGISQLQNQISGLHDQLSDVHNAQMQLNQAMVALAEQVKRLNTMVRKPITKKDQQIAPPPPPMVFHLKAIVPGRAWIVSRDGLSESVSVGDSIPQYGTVKVVDANRGMVLTSSGKVIGYGENDR